MVTEPGQTGQPCGTCGETHRPGYCVAHNRQGRPCGCKAIPGGTVCARFHGGAAPQVQAAANRRLELQAVEADARALLAHHGVTTITDPLDELVRLTSEVVAFKDALAARVNALHDIRYSDARGTEQLRSEVALLERAYDRAGKFLELLVKTGFEERITRAKERATDAQIAWTVTRLAALVRDLDLTPAQQAVLPALLDRHFATPTSAPTDSQPKHATQETP